MYTSFITIIVHFLQGWFVSNYIQFHTISAIMLAVSVKERVTKQLLEHPLSDFAKNKNNYS